MLIIIKNIYWQSNIFAMWLVETSLEARNTRHQFLSAEMAPDMNIVNIW